MYMHCVGPPPSTNPRKVVIDSMTGWRRANFPMVSVSWQYGADTLVCLYSDHNYGCFLCYWLERGREGRWQLSKIL